MTIILALGLLGNSLCAYQSNSNFNDGYVLAETKKVSAIIFDRLNFSVKNQNESEDGTKII